VITLSPEEVRMPCPGEFIGQDWNSLVLLNGSVCRLLEDGVEPADAAACVPHA